MVRALWRISNYATLDGIGGYRFSARWHNKGRPVVYATDHPASALVEMMAHSDRNFLPDSFQLLKIECTANINPERAIPTENWRVSREATRKIGDEWLASNRSLFLEVPSAIVPEIFHTLINPLHPDAHHLEVTSKFHFPLDARLR